MSKAYIIEVRNRTAGIVAGDEHGFRFFSAERAFDRLEGREFRFVARSRTFLEMHAFA